MTSLPLETERHRVVLPRTIKAIREALTPEEREDFTEELENTQAYDVRQVLEKWWLRGVMNLAGAWDRIRDIEAGRARVIPIEDVVPELRGRV
ncbi:hypothetical protein [Catenulispora subtropica]